MSISNAALHHEIVTLKSLSKTIAEVIKAGIKVRENYYLLFAKFERDDVRSYNYYNREGNGLPYFLSVSWLSEEQSTGEFFPGREIVRPSVNFGTSSKKENARSCRKNYSKSDSHSPGIFTVQCVCSHPKLIDISVMRECEGVSTALSVLLSRFRKLPRVCYYENACNKCKSITLRFPWIYNESAVVCDRFHYHGHTCNSICDPDSYLCCDEHSTSGAESINHLWNFSKSHLRFLRPDNLMPFLALRSMFLNVRSCTRKDRKKREISMNEFKLFVQSKWSCECKMCQDLNIE